MYGGVKVMASHGGARIGEASPQALLPSSCGSSTAQLSICLLIRLPPTDSAPPPPPFAS